MFLNDFEKLDIAASRNSLPLDVVGARPRDTLNACSRVSELENQLNLQAASLRNSTIACEKLAESLRRFSLVLDSLSEERIAILAKLNTLRLANHEDGISALELPFRLAVYIHIPKCSGTSLLMPYLENFEHMVKWFGVNASLADLLQGVSSEYPHRSAIYCGHFCLSDFEAHKDMFPGCDIKYFAHFRDPIERAISYYDFISRMETHPDHGSITNFSDDLRGWFGEMLLGQSQVQFLSPTLLTGAGIGSDLLDYLASGKLRLFDCRNVAGCAAEINLHTGIKLLMHAHSQIVNKNPGVPLGGAQLSASSLSQLQEICQVDHFFINHLVSQGILS